jgi:hypothetical protein
MRLTTSFAAALLLGAAASALAQPPVPQPGPEHDVLKRDVGAWDVTMEMTAPGMPPFQMTGVETNALFGGLWLLTEYKSDFMGQVFEQHGLIGYDPAKKAYVSVWANTMSTSLNVGESTFDAATNTLTGWSEMPDPAGGKAKAKTVATWPGPDQRVVKIYMPADAPEPFMTMTYKKRK